MRRALVAAAVVLILSAPAAQASSGSVLGVPGLVVSVDAARRTGGQLVITYTLANPGTSTVVFYNQGIIATAAGGAPRLWVVNPLSGAVGRPLTSGSACVCTTLPAGLPAGSAVTASVAVEDPGGAAVDVDFAVMAPVLEVTVDGAPGATTSSSTLTGRTRVVLPRSQLGATRSTGTRIDLDTDVLFAFGSARLTAAAGATLNVAATQLQAQSGRRLAIHGHTDGIGTPSSNQRLSLQRARAVQQALAVKLGPGWTFDVQGFGETTPIAPEKMANGSDNPAGRRLNRRVELSLLT